MYWVTLLTICVGLIIIIIFMPFIVGVIEKIWDLEEAWLEKRKERKR